MSHTEVLEAQGSAPAYALVVVLFFLAMFGIAWLSVHQGPLLLAIWRRGRAYRARLRAARHVRPHRLVRSTTR